MLSDPFHLDHFGRSILISALTYHAFGGFQWQFQVSLATCILLVWIVEYMRYGPVYQNSKKAFGYSREFLNRARKVKDFPPPYPNTWYFALKASDLKKGDVKPLQMVGQELVIFRNWNGQVGILRAFCPHLGAHLGIGGTVSSQGNLKCPFHEWEFDVSGKCKSIPYCTTRIEKYSSIHQHAYPICEAYGLIFMWFHADNEPPRFDILKHTITEDAMPCEKLVRVGNSMEFNMHMMEPSLNTQDWYHFGTTHSKLAVMPFLQTGHTVREVSFKLDGTFSFFEDMQFGVFGSKQRTLPGVENKVQFCGPGIACIVSQVGKCINTTFATFTPIEPFKTKVNIHTYSSGGWAGLWKYLSLVTSFTVEQTIRQDLLIWEHKSNPTPKRLVPGDRNGFLEYRKWLEQFYSESSPQQQTLDW